MKPEFDLRLATNQEGPIVAGLCAQCHYGHLEALDWSDIWPHWVVAARDGAIVAALQICLGKPVGRAEYLAVDPLLSHEDRAAAIKLLALHACALLARDGAQAVSFMIPHELRAYRKVLKRRGAVTIFSGSTLVKALPRPAQLREVA